MSLASWYVAALHQVFLWVCQRLRARLEASIAAGFKQLFLAGLKKRLPGFINPEVDKFGMQWPFGARSHEQFLIENM